jgi:hypothetical protein
MRVYISSSRFMADLHGGNDVKPRKTISLTGLAGVVLSAFILNLGSAQVGTRKNPIEMFKAAAQAGAILYRLTEPEEIKALLGVPEGETTRPDGGMSVLEWTYPGLKFKFSKMNNDKRPFVLYVAQAEGTDLDIGQSRKLVLRTAADLAKMDSFTGLENVSMVSLDLRDHLDDLKNLPFDSLTEWPPDERMPTGFSPAAIMAEGTNPGLGVRALHAEGIDGRGVHIAIIDQPLLRDHREYASALVRYDATGLEDMPPQMHGPAVLSNAVGRTCGVAPGAEATFFAVAMWKRDNAPYIEAMNKIFALNDDLPEAKRIRVVSISTGMFSRYPRYEEWKAVLAEAERRGILVITCDETFMKYGTLGRLPGRDPDDPRSYTRGVYGAEDGLVYVPADNRTIASPEGKDVYTYEPAGGMSWAAPYMAGLAALALQVGPKLGPRDIVRLFTETATPGPAGPVINPREIVRRAKD